MKTLVNIWRVERIIPIPKLGKINDQENSYRPIYHCYYCYQSSSCWKSLVDHQSNPSKVKQGFSQCGVLSFLLINPLRESSSSPMLADDCTNLATGWVNHTNNLLRFQHHLELSPYKCAQQTLFTLWTKGSNTIFDYLNLQADI